jgi:hypothetical protein
LRQILRLRCIDDIVAIDPATNRVDAGWILSICRDGSGRVHRHDAMVPSGLEQDDYYPRSGTTT